MPAGEGISGRRSDGIPGGQDARVADSGPVDTGRQLNDRGQEHAKVIGNQRIKPLPLILEPVKEDRDQNQVVDGKGGNELHQRRQGILNTVSVILKQEQVLNIHDRSLLTTKD